MQVLDAAENEFPTVSQIRGGFEWAVGLSVVIQRDGGCIVWIGEDLKVIAAGVIHMVEHNLVFQVEECDLADRVVSRVHSGLEKVVEGSGCSVGERGMFGHECWSEGLNVEGFLT
jgi:hypothetical protein